MTKTNVALFNPLWTGRMKSVKGIALSLFMSVMCLICISAAAQTRSGARGSLANPFEKIVTNPSSKFVPNDSLANASDGYIKLYFTSAFAGKVKEVVYHTYNLPVARLNPVRIAAGSGNPFIIPNLKRNSYALLELHLTDGTVIKCDSARTIDVFSADKSALPAGNLSDYTRNMDTEGSNVALFISNFNARNNAAAARNGDGTSDFTNCDLGAWTVTSTVQFGGPVISAVNSCGYEYILHCVYHQGSGATPGEILDYASGDPCDGTLRLTPRRAGQTYATLPLTIKINGGITAACMTRSSTGVNQPVSLSADAILTSSTWNYTTTNPSTITFAWSNGTTGRTTTATAPGTYTVTATWNQCTYTKSITITQAPFTGVAAASTTVCPESGAINLYDLLTGEDTGGTWTRTSGTGGTFTAASGTFNPLGANTSAFTYTKAATSPCTDASTSLTVTVRTVTKPVYTVTQPVCAGTGKIDVATYATGTTFSYNGGAYASAVSWPNLSQGSYSVKAKTAEGCTATDTTIVINAPSGAVTATISGNQTVCSTDSTTLTAGGGGTYRWNIGSATGTVIGTTAVIKVKPAAATTYFVTVTGASGCTDTKSIVVNAPRPALILTNIIDICKGQSTTVRADDPSNPVAGYTYRWLAPAAVAGNTSQQLTVTPVVTTNYTVERTTPAGCKDTATSIVRVMEQPVIGTVAKTDASCSGTNDGKITINATSPSGLVMEYSITGTTWQTSNVFSNLAPGAYSVLVRNQNGICQATTGTNVTIARLQGPQSGIAGPDRRCANEQVQFDASPAVTGASYSWSVTNNGSGTAAPVITGGSTNSNFIATFAANTPQGTARTETVTLIVSLNGCSATYTKAINITSPVFANAGADTAVCNGGQLFLGLPAGTGGPATASFSWGPADKIQGTTTAAQFTTVALTADQEYTLTVTDPVNGCTRTDRVFVYVNTARNPIANAGPDLTLSAGQTATLGSTTTSVTDALSIVSYTWSTVSGVSGNTQLSDATLSRPVFTMPNPASNYLYELAVRRQYKSTSTTPGLVCYSRDTVSIVKPAIQPDLTPILTILPAVVTGDNVVLECRIRVREVNGAATTATPIYVSIPASSHYTVQPYNPAGTTYAGSPVQNSNWAYAGLINGRHFFQYTGPLIAASGSSAVGFTINYSANKTAGKENVIAAILDGSGGENNFLNNQDSETVLYSPDIK